MMRSDSAFRPTWSLSLMRKRPVTPTKSLPVSIASRILAGSMLPPRRTASRTATKASYAVPAKNDGSSLNLARYVLT